MCRPARTHVLDIVEMLGRYLDGALGEPVFWVVVFAVVALDALVPFLPSGSTITAAGVFASSGRLALPSVVLVATAAAVTGDNLVYAIGRRAGPHVLAGLERRRRGAGAYQWMRRAMRDRTAELIIMGRYVPGARMAVMLAAGALRCPPRRFLPLDALAAMLWAGTAALAGYFGGSLFAHRPLLGVAAGALAGATVVLLVEWTGRRRAVRAELGARIAAVHEAGQLRCPAWRP
jgi:membrane protein DedA with SNARE-associated domain